MLSTAGFQALLPLLDAALRVDDGVCGDIQVVTGDRLSLLMVAARGIPAEICERYATVRVDDGTHCAHALQEHRRVVIRDIYKDPGFAPHVDAAEAMGWRAAQATPLKDRHGTMIGVLSTHFAQPHHPSKDSLARLDCLCAVAERVLEVMLLHREPSGPLDRTLSPDSARALTAAAVLLPMLSKSSEPQPILDSLESHLSVVTAELAAKGRRLFSDA